MAIDCSCVSGPKNGRGSGCLDLEPPQDAAETPQTFVQGHGVGRQRSTCYPRILTPTRMGPYRNLRLRSRRTQRIHLMKNGSLSGEPV